jgi:hypothetical protein
MYAFPHCINIISVNPKPNLKSIFQCIFRTKGSFEVRCMCELFIAWKGFTVRICQHLAKHQTGGRPFVSCARLLIQYRPSHKYPSYWKPFLQPQLEDAPCHGDWVTLMTNSHRNSRKKYFCLSCSYLTHYSYP